MEEKEVANIVLQDSEERKLNDKTSGKVFAWIAAILYIIALIVVVLGLVVSLSIKESSASGFPFMMATLFEQAIHVYIGNWFAMIAIYRWIKVRIRQHKKVSRSRTILNVINILQLIPISALSAWLLFASVLAKELSVTGIFAINLVINWLHILQFLPILLYFIWSVYRAKKEKSNVHH